VSSILSRWPILHEHEVTAADLAGDGLIRSATLDGWITAARTDYFASTSLAGRDLHLVPRRPLDPREVLGSPPSVAISVGVAEIHPDSFTLNVRLRPLGSHADRPVTVRYVVTVRRPDGSAQAISTELRDELIALEHSAAHFN
jgi:hypothetical protein